MNRLRMAIVGGGHLGGIHARLLQRLEHVELVGVVDPVDAARQRAREAFGVPTFHHHDELPDGIDAAIVATTTEFHHAVGLDLLRRGMHLFVEKPLARNVAEADELVAAAAIEGRILQVGHVERFNPAWTAVAPYLWRPRYLEAVRTSGYTFRSTDIGAVFDLMIHDLDLVLSVVQSEVVDVDAMGATVFGPHEDMAHAHLRFANGCIANLNTSRTSFQPQRSMQIVTDWAYASVDFAAPSAQLVRPSRQVLRGEIDVNRLSATERDQLRHRLFTDLLPVKELRIPERNAILEEQRQFLDCIRNGTQPLVSAEQGRRAVAIGERILDQIHTSSVQLQRSERGHPAILRSRLFGNSTDARRAAS